MADDAERAAKAARAKAMLKKRQQQQKAGISPSPSPAPPAVAANKAPPLSSKLPSPSMTTRSPEHKDASLLFGATTSDKAEAATAVVDFGEFGVLTPSRLPRSPTPLSSPSPPPPSSLVLEPNTSSSNNNGSVDPVSDKMRILVSNQQQTISLLVNEKASLAAQLGKLEELQTKSSVTEVMLEDERGKVESLTARLQHAEEQARAAVGRLDEVERREREAHEKSREQDREFDLVRRTAGELRTQLESRDRDLRALKEQVEADDRVETLERSLKATQDRTEELEFQLTKVKQNHTSSVQERESLARELASLTSQEAQWSQRYTSLEQELASAQHEITTLSASLEDTERARAHLESQLASNESSLAGVQHQLTVASSELASHARQLHAAHGEVVSAQRRAEDAEQAQRNLQAENSGLLTQLEEVRPKVVELSNRNAESEERIWDADRKVRVLEMNVGTLEAQVAERVTAEEDATARLELAEREGRREEEKHREDLREIQDAYASVMRDLEYAKSHAMQLEKEREEQRAALSAKELDQDRWKTEANSRAAEAAAAMSELSAQRQKEDDAVAIVERAQVEIESLRDQLALREDELMRLREDAPSSSSSSSPKLPHHERQPSLNQEMLSAVRQQHALDLSTAHSRIRSLETEVFEAQAVAHTFQRRVTTLEAEITQLRAQGLPDVPGRRSTPPFPRGSSFHGGSEDSRRHSFSSTRPHTPSSLRPLIVPRAVYDENLSAATRHKRKVSLSMLKARIESERAALQHSESSASLSSVMGSPRSSTTRGLSNTAIVEVDESMELSRGGEQTPRTSLDDRPRSVVSDSYSPSRSQLESYGGKGKRLPQFLDESHVFWCHSCRGDLMVL